MTRSARVQSARAWLKTYNGSNIAAGYRKHFGVDWVCAFRELAILGVRIDSTYKDQILKSVEGHIAARQRRKARREEPSPVSFDRDENFAHIAGYTSAGFAYGITWEECEQLDQGKLIHSHEDTKTSDNDELQDLPF